MKEYRHNNVTIRVYGSACHATIKEEMITFLKKVELRKNKQKGVKRNDNID